MRAGCVAAEDGWMSRYMFVVHSNAAEGREQEYNDYMAGHVDDILALPGVIWGRRGTVAKAQARQSPDAPTNITVFEVEQDDLQAFTDSMHAGVVAAGDGWMSRYRFVVHSNAAEGREQEYNDYMAGHVDDILALPGVIWGRRGTVAKAQARPAPDAHQYITVFEVETDDLQAFIDEMNARVMSGRIARSTSVAGAVPVFWEVVQMDAASAARSGV